jgi:hypothetical protein
MEQLSRRAFFRLGGAVVASALLPISVAAPLPISVATPLPTPPKHWREQLFERWGRLSEDIANFGLNDDLLRAQYRTEISRLFGEYHRQHYIYEYQIICDERNNTPTMIDNNEFQAVVHFREVRSIACTEWRFLAHA